MDPVTIRQIATSAAVFAVATGLALFVRRLLLSVLRRWANTTETAIDDILLSVIRGPSVFWAVALALYVGIGTSVLPPRVIQVSFSVLHAIVILSFTFVAANVASHLLRFAAERAELPLTGLTQVVVKGVVITIGEAFGACHAPHHAPPEFIEKYVPVFAKG